MEWEELQRKVDQFADELTPGLIGEVLTGLAYALFGHNMKRLWEEAREIQAGFNSKLRFPTREKQQECWERFQRARTALVDIGRRERESKEHCSKIHRDLILDTVREAQVRGFTCYDREGVEYLKRAGQKLRSAGAMLKERKHEMLGEHKGECFKAMQEVKEDHDIRWANIKKGREQRAQDWRERIEANIAKNRAAYQKCSDALARQRARESDLESKIAESSNPRWVERAQEWLQECHEKINDMKASLDRLETWIHEGEEQLSR